MNWLLIILAAVSLSGLNLVYPLTYENFPSDWLITSVLIFSVCAAVSIAHQGIRQRFEKSKNGYNERKLLGIKLI